MKDKKLAEGIAEDLLFELATREKKLLKDMFERMEEMLTDDIFERYIPGETNIYEVAVKLWRKDVDTYISLCKAFGFRVSKRNILKKGEAWIKAVEV